MSRYKIVLNNKYGVYDTQTETFITDCIYDDYELIPNYQDLSSRNGTEILVLSNNGTLRNFTKNFIGCDFFDCERGIISVKDNPYEEINHFYKNLALAKLNQEVCIIDINGNLLANSDITGEWLGDGEEDRGSYSTFCYDFVQAQYHFENYDYSFENHKIIQNVNNYDLMELIRMFFYFEAISNWSECDRRETNHQFGIQENKTYVYMEPLPGSLPIERDLVQNQNFGSYEFDNIINVNSGDISFHDDKFIVKLNGKFAFMNRFYYLIGDFFDDYVLVYYDDREQYAIKNNDTWYSLSFKGDFVKEIIIQPELFVSHQVSKDEIIKDLQISDKQVEQFENRVYWKMDDFILDDNEKEERLINPNFIRTDEWVQNQLLNETASEIRDFRPFSVSYGSFCRKLSKEELEAASQEDLKFYKYLGFLHSHRAVPSQQELEILIIEYNRIFGNTFSSYEIGEELTFGVPSFNQNESKILNKSGESLTKGRVPLEPNFQSIGL